MPSRNGRENADVIHLKALLIGAGILAVCVLLFSTGLGGLVALGGLGVIGCYCAGRAVLSFWEDVVTIARPPPERD